MSQIRPLSELRRDQMGRVASISPVTEDLKSLLDAGLIPQSQIKVISNNPHDVLLSAGRRVLALDRQTASGVLVELV